MVMHKNHEGPAVFDMLNNALEIARQRKKVTDERNIRILIAQMHVVKVVLTTLQQVLLLKHIVIYTLCVKSHICWVLRHIMILSSYTFVHYPGGVG